jgi:hypothetical protein
MDWKYMAMSKRNSTINRLSGLKLFYLVLILIAIFGIYGVYKNTALFVDGFKETGSSSELTASITKADKGLAKYELKFRTGTERENNAISVLSFRLKFSSDNQVVNEKGETVENIIPDISINDSDRWKIAVNRVYNEGPDRYVDFSLINLEKEGFKNSEHQTLASFYLKNSGNENLHPEISIVREFSQAFTKSRPVTNVWNPPQNLPINQ